MRKGKKIIVANWKMNPATVREARALFAKTKRAASRHLKVETVICSPFPYLGLFAHADSAAVSLGAQDSFYSNTGRATGEVSPEMLSDLGVSAVIVGHSERRAFGETDEIVSKKALAVLKEGLRAILCIGEKERDEDAAFYAALKNQIKSSLAGIQRRYLIDLIIAYEPVWAIGKSYRDAMQPKDIRETSIFIKKVLADIYGQDITSSIPILYGGSVESENAGAILSDGGVDGLLVGQRSLDADDFIEILKIANAV